MNEHYRDIRKIDPSRGDRLADGSQEPKAVGPKFGLIAVDGDLVEEGVDRLAQARHGGHGGGEVLVGEGGLGGAPGLTEGREKLLDLAEELDCMVLEDAAYQSLRYNGAPVPPILALELARKGTLEDCRTVYCGSFSKTLSPGLRVGWVVAASPVIQQLVLMKQAADLHSATINQMAIYKVAEACFDAHVDKIRAAYMARRDAMLEALARHMPEGVEWTRPEGGMFIWLNLLPGSDGAQLLARALETVKVAFVPGQAFHPDGSGANTIRLSFSNSDEATIAEGIARLGAVLRG